MTYGRIAAIVGGLLVIGLVLWGAYHHGVTTERAAQQLTIAGMQADAQRAVDAADKRAREAEQRAATDTAAIAQQNMEQVTHANAERDAALSRARTAGQLRFQCPAGDRVAVAAATPGAPAGHAEASGGLSADDADFLIRRAALADEIVHQLEAAQAVILLDRRVCNGR